MANRHRKIKSRRVHTRKIDRLVARNTARKQGHRRINKNNWFALNWKQFVTE